MEKEYSKEYRVRMYETDFRGTIRPVVIMDYLQDTASEHSARSGISVSDLRRKNLTWVLSRYHLRMLRYPKAGEDVCVKTWRSAIDGFFALREFEMTGSGEEPLVLATSSWAMINLETRRPVRIEPIVGELPVIPRRALQDDFPTLPKLDEWDIEGRFQVRPGDLDLNRHVNHAVYAGWALDTVPEEMTERFIPSEIEASYRAEAFLGDVVVTRSRQAAGGNEPLFLQQVLKEKDGRELTRLRTAWQTIKLDR